MAHYSSADCWHLVLICTKNHTHDPVNCTRSELKCDGKHIHKRQ